MDLPKYRQSSKKGEDGITILKRIIETQLEWIFRPNHKEHDFGIDAYIDIVSNVGQITGKTIAIQVKTGRSYFNETNKFGWVYRGQISHLNYYLNHDIPVVIVLVDELKQKAYWCYCDPNKTANAGNNWKITIPYSQELKKESKDELIKYVSPVKDYVSQLEHYWNVNEMLKETDRLALIVDKSQIVSLEYHSLVLALDRLKVTDELIESMIEKVDIWIHGYNEDNRELFEIPEVKQWIDDALSAIEGWSYFLYKGEGAAFFQVLQLCYMNYTPIEGGEYIVNGIKKRKLEVDFRSGRPFLEYLFNDLNSFCQKFNIGEETNFVITKNAVQFLVGDIPEAWKR